jgi:phage portal protein BeeE
VSILDEFHAAVRGPSSLAVVDGPGELRTDPAFADLGPLISALVQGDGFLPSISFLGDTVEQVYEAATWSYAAISANAEAAASLPIVVERREDGGKWVEDADHEANAFVEEPLGPGTRPAWNLNQYIEVIAQQLYLTGDSVGRIFSYRGGALPAIDPWHPQDVFIWDDGRRPVEYELQPRPRGERMRTSQGFATRLESPKDILHVMFGGPSSLIRGHSPLTVARRPITTDRLAQERVKANLGNKVAPGLIFRHTPGEARGYAAAHAMSTDQRGAFIAYLREEYGQAVKEGLPLIIGADTEVLGTPETLSQLAVADVRGMTREEILGIFRTPPPLLGILGENALQNIRWSIKVWWGIALAPLLRNILWTINAHIMRRFFGADVRLWFQVDESEIGLEILRSRAEVAQILVGIGHGANDASQRVQLGMPIREELEAANMGVVVAGHAEDAPGGTLPGAATDDEAELAQEAAIDAQ